MKYKEKSIQILEAARALFAENGYASVSTKSLALKANVNEITIFRHFGSKEKLFDSMFDHFVIEPLASDLNQLQLPNVKDLLFTIGNAFHQYFVENLQLIKVSFNNQNQLSKEHKLQKYPVEIKEIISQQISKLKKLSAAEAETFSICFIAAIQGICLNLYVFKTIYGKTDFDSCLNTIVTKFS